MGAEASDSERRIRALALLILAQAVMTFLAGVNLMWPLTRTPLAAGEFVRWREILSLTFITPGSVVLLFLILWTLERGRRDATGPLTLFALSACFLGLSMGVHEPISHLPLQAAGTLARSLYFWDEVYSHIVFFSSYAGISLALIWSQTRNPLAAPLGKLDVLLFAGCGVIAGTGIFFTLVPGGDIRVDLAVIAAVILLAELLRKRRPFALLPVSITLEGAYVLAFAALLLREL